MFSDESRVFLVRSVPHSGVSVWFLENSTTKDVLREVYFLRLSVYKVFSTKYQSEPSGHHQQPPETGGVSPSSAVDLKRGCCWCGKFHLSVFV